MKIEYNIILLEERWENNFNKEVGYRINGLKQKSLLIRIEYKWNCWRRW